MDQWPEGAQGLLIYQVSNQQVGQIKSGEADYIQ